MCSSDLEYNLTTERCKEIMSFIIKCVNFILQGEMFKVLHVMINLVIIELQRRQDELHRMEEKRQRDELMRQAEMRLKKLVLVFVILLFLEVNFSKDK